MPEQPLWNRLKLCKQLSVLVIALFLLLLTGCGTQSLPEPVSPSVNAAAIAAGGESLLMLQESTALPSNDLEVHFLNVGQGLSVLAVSGGQTMLYDGGDRDHSSFVVSYLKEQGVNTLDYIIASHYDADHINGLVGAMNVFSVQRIIGPDYVHTSRVYESFIRQAQELGKEIEHPPVGTEYTLGNAKITVLSPETITSNSNNNSIAVKIENGEHTIIIMGDAEHAEEADIISSGIDLDCTVLVLGHHGSASSTTWDLLQKTIPEYAIISCGRNNSYGHPHEETMEKLESMEIDFFRTDKQGTITVTSDGHTLTWNTNPSTDYSSGRQDDPLKEDDASESAAVIINESTEMSTKNLQMVWQSAAGSKYHSIPNCGTMNPEKAAEITLDDAELIGLGRCKNCWQ